MNYRRTRPRGGLSEYLWNTAMPEQFEPIKFNFYKILLYFRPSKLKKIKLHDWFKSYGDLKWGLANRWILQERGSVTNEATLSSWERVCLQARKIWSLSIIGYANRLFSLRNSDSTQQPTFSWLSLFNKVYKTAQLRPNINPVTERPLNWSCVHLSKIWSSNHLQLRLGIYLHLDYDIGSWPVAACLDQALSI